MQLPQLFTERMRRCCSGHEFERFLASYELPLRRGVRVNTAKIDIARFLEAFQLPLTPSPFAEDSFIWMRSIKQALIRCSTQARIICKNRPRLRR